MSNTAIKVHNLTKIYKLYDKPIDRLKESLHPFKKKYHKEFYALHNVSFEIKKGETVGIIGKNGSGKSTLLKLITGVTTPTSGRVSVHGRISAILELGAGFNPEMTGLENIYLNTSINGMSKKETDKKINEIVEFSELNEFIHQPMKTYSSGMKAKLAFSVAISMEPDILIVDEALSVGDAAFRRKCYAKMEEIRQGGATILFVSHSEGSIVSLCSRAVWISNGEQIIDGAPKLVTGLYMKYINENKIEKVKIEKEYENLANSKEDEKKEKQQKNISLSSIDHRPLTNMIEEFYNPVLKPKSTIYYEENGAKISDVKITTLNGEKVNVLNQGKEYIYSYKVISFDVYDDIYFGMLIKSNQGVEISGAGYSALKERKIKNIKANSILTINWRFKCLLNKGEYYFNCGVRNNIDGSFLHRITDSAMIRVISENNKIKTGLCSLVLDCEIEGITWE